MKYKIFENVYVIIAVWFFIVIFILVAWEWKHYSRFIQEMMAFKTSHINGVTEIVNTREKIKFSINDYCRVEHNFVDHFFNERRDWNGQLVCSSAKEQIDMMITNVIIKNDKYKYKIFRGKDVYMYDFGDSYALDVINETTKTRFFVGGYPADKEIFSQIENTISGF